MSFEPMMLAMDSTTDEQELAADEKTREWRQAGARVLVFVMFATLLGMLGLNESFRHAFSVQNIERIATSLGVMGPAVIVIAGLVTPLFLLPRWPICFVSGLLYGVFWGTVLSTLASLLGATLHFYLARTFLAATARRLIARTRLAGLSVAPGKTFAAILFLRAFPLSNNAATNLMAGAMHLRADLYILASLLGMIPSSIMYAAWGKFAKKPSPGFLVLILAVLILLIAGGLHFRRQRARWLKAREESGERTSS